VLGPSAASTENEQEELQLQDFERATRATRFRGASVFTAETILDPQQSSLQVLHFATPTVDALIPGNKPHSYLPYFALNFMLFFGYYHRNPEQ